MSQNKENPSLMKVLFNHKLTYVILFLLLVVVGAVFFSYLNIYTKTNKIYFSEYVDLSEPEAVAPAYITKFIKASDLADAKFTYKYSKGKWATLGEADVVQSGYYEFTFTMENTSGLVDRLEVTPLVHANWVKGFHYLGSLTTVSSTSEATGRVDYSMILPAKPAFLVQVKYPQLYLKVTVSYKATSGRESITYYIKDTSILKNTDNWDN